MRRRRLFWKYTTFFVLLVTAELLASGITELYFSYQENQAALVALQREKALAAASQIEGFIKEIERQMGWVTQPQRSPAGTTLEQRRFDFFRLQRQVPAITEVSYIDAAGREQLRVSRLAMDAIGSQADLSADPRFVEAKARKVYRGPVYFRKESEPYMVIAIAEGGQSGGVTAAEVNLKFIWDVVSQIKIGKAGQAFVGDGQGALIAHPGISLVLQKTGLTPLDPARDELEVLADQFNRMAVQLQESYAGLERKVDARTRELQEALEQQTATAEILGVISGSPTDSQPVMDAVAQSAARLCDAVDAQIFRIDGDFLRSVAIHGVIPKYPGQPITRGFVSGRAVLERRTVHVNDLAGETDREFPDARPRQQATGTRTMLATPLLREGVPIGVITIRRLEVRPFPDKQIKLLETFADQAVIAIENVRLFQELQARTQDLSQSLEETGALSEVIRAVSSSLDLREALDTVAPRSLALSSAAGCAVLQLRPGPP